jgi:hypothetical protein
MAGDCIENIFNDQKKANVKYIVISFLHELGQQLLKLPHEMVDKDIGITGTTYDDIKRSYIDGVDHMESLLTGLTDETNDYLSDLKKIESKEEFIIAKSKIKCLVALADRMGIMDDKVLITDIDPDNPPVGVVP